MPEVVGILERELALDRLRLAEVLERRVPVAGVVQRVPEGGVGE